MHTAKYTVNEVEERTQVPAGTLRQWERRYGFPMPERSQSGYRLYSDNDIDRIDAMKRYIADGIPASRAAELVRSRAPGGGPRSTEELTGMLVEALVDFDETRADRVLSEAHTLHPAETVVIEVMRPCLVGIGQRWHDGEITVSTEHFATSYIMGRLRSLMSLSGQNRGRQAKLVLVACAPGDQHEFGALMLAVMLRRSGIRVFYIGANTPIADLHATAAALRPDAVVISATTGDALDQLEDGRDLFRGMPSLLAFGGPAFERDPARAEVLGGHYLADSIERSVERLEDLIENRVSA